MNTTNQTQEPVQAKSYIIKLIRRRDGKKYYYRHDGNMTARRESSMLLEESVAKQLALAIRRGHKDFTAVALQFKRQKRTVPAKKHEEAITIKLVRVKNDQS